MDLLEQLKDICGCFYISDLRLEPYRTIAKKIFLLILSSYSHKELDDVKQYIFS